MADRRRPPASQSPARRTTLGRVSLITRRRSAIGYPQLAIRHRPFELIQTIRSEGRRKNRVRL